VRTVFFRADHIELHGSRVLSRFRLRGALYNGCTPR
jgi:hypothetical protein